jgi:hypothetical protein
MHIIGDVLTHPNWVFSAFGKVCAGQIKLGTIASQKLY